MAQSSNLTIGVTVDTGNATANIKVLQEQIRQLTKEIKTATTEALKTGDFTAVRTYGQEIDKLNRALKQEQQEQRAVGAATKATARAQLEATAITRELTQHTASFGRALGITGLSARSLRVGMAGLFGAEIVNQIRETINSLNELQSAAKAIGGAGGGDPAQLKGLRSEFRAMGEDAKFADQLIGQFNKTLDEARLKQGQGGIELRGGRGAQSTGTPHDCRQRRCHRAGAHCDRGEPRCDWNAQHWRGSGQSGGCTRHAQRILAITDATTRNEATLKIWGLDVQSNRGTIKTVCQG
jgi:hypothetical protein